jgi:hypothetical protein
MIGLELVMGGLLQLAAAGECRAQKAPHILSEPLTGAISYNYTKSRNDLQGFNIDTVSPYGPEHNAKIGGLMSGEIRVESRVRFVQERYPARGSGCVHVDSVDMIVHVEPTIYIASEYAKGTCQHNAITAHEKQHVQTDIAIAKKYAAILKDKVAAYLRRAGYSYGPFPIEKMEDAQRRIQDDIHAMIQQNNDQMTHERKRLQQKIDSLEEYERVAAQCKGGLAPSAAGRSSSSSAARASRQSRWNQ